MPKTTFMTTDLKSVVRKDVPVRVRPRAPLKTATDFFSLSPVNFNNRRVTADNIDEKVEKTLCVHPIGVILIKVTQINSIN